MSHWGRKRLWQSGRRVTCPIWRYWIWCAHGSSGEVTQVSPNGLDLWADAQGTGWVGVQIWVCWGEDWGGELWNFLGYTCWVIWSGSLGESAEPTDITKVGDRKEHLRGRAWRVPERGPQKPSEITAVVLSWRWTCECSLPAFVRAAAVRAWLPHHTGRGGFSLPSSPSLPPRCSLQLSLHGGQDSLPHPRARVIWSSGWLLTWRTGLQAVWEICSLSNAWLSGLSRYPILNVRSCILAVSIAPTPPPLLSSVHFQMPGDALVGPLRDTGICRDRSHRGGVDDMGEGEVTARGSGEALTGLGLGSSSCDTRGRGERWAFLYWKWLGVTCGPNGGWFLFEGGGSTEREEVEGAQGWL